MLGFCFGANFEFSTLIIYVIFRYKTTSLSPFLIIPVTNHIQFQVIWCSQTFSPLLRVIRWWCLRTPEQRTKTPFPEGCASAWVISLLTSTTTSVLMCSVCPFYSLKFISSHSNAYHKRFNNSSYIYRIKDGQNSKFPLTTRINYIAIKISSLRPSDVTFAPSIGEQYQAVDKEMTLACTVSNLDNGQVTAYSYTYPASCSSCQPSSTSTYTLVVRLFN